MNKYTITVTETSEVTYVVEAENADKAEELFSNWADDHQEWISDDLMNNSFGWDYSKAEPIMMDCEPDITYQSLKQ